MNDTNYYDYMTVEDLKDILEGLPNEMLVVIPVVDEEDVDHIYGFRKVRTAGILMDEYEDCPEVLCINGATGGWDISGQVFHSGRDVGVKEVLYGGFEHDN